ncbi:NfeD family protein [Pseudonocardia spinosispora]|uniref:NfeD family protein n=1 Tax=Pseudonocardia spinosispora TaxID=103441 RepID=UPI0003FE6B17|nr:NfeD family protein [Pseudonocardia spinosispora]
MPLEAWLWLVGGILLIGVELLTGTFVLVMLGAGALAAGAVAAVLDPPALVDVAVFAMVSVVLLFGVRPALRRRLYVELEPSGNDPIGRSALVVHRVDRDGGQIKIEGELWSAKSLETDRVFEPGDRVTVMQLSGVTAVVSTEL